MCCLDDDVVVVIRTWGAKMGKSGEKSFFFSAPAKPLFSTRAENWKVRKLKSIICMIMTRWSSACNWFTLLQIPAKICMVLLCNDNTYYLRKIYEFWLPNKKCFKWRCRSFIPLGISHFGSNFSLCVHYMVSAAKDNGFELFFDRCDWTEVICDAENL